MKAKKIQDFAPSNWYQDNYRKSIENSNEFWLEKAKMLDWQQFPTISQNGNFKDNFKVSWFEDGKLNICYNCVDRHVLAGNGDKIALIWEGDEPNNSKKITYAELLKEVAIFANILEKNNIKKGDNVIIYLPMIPQAAYAMLACARIGAIHSVVFGGFSAKALADRIKNCNPKLIITADESKRGGRIFPLKANVDEALNLNKKSITTLVVKNTGNKISFNSNDLWLEDEAKLVKSSHKITYEINAEDPLFILYTSGSTGKPKGLVHSSAGYLLHAAFSFKTVFDYQENEIYFCTADIGWITGHSYVIYGPLANGATSIMFEGVPSYPDFSRFWQIIDKYQVNIFYTAPTAIRALMKEGDQFLSSTSRQSLRILGTVGEPINPEAWDWYFEKIGHKKCEIVDTWWQTETGGHMITAIPSHIKTKPSCATKPFFGIQPAILDNNGHEIIGVGEGNLCIKNSWPGQARSIFGDHDRFIKTYFSQFAGFYFTGDGAKRDEDGYFRITGRVDDVLNVSGHRLGTAEIEAALNKHPKVAESAVVGFPHDIKGEGIYAFVILNNTKENIPLREDAPASASQCEAREEKLKKELKNLVRSEIGAIANPDIIQFVSDLPKTRSGKIMRRIIRKIAAKDFENLGDLSTLTNPLIVEEIITNAKSNLEN